MKKTCSALSIFFFSMVLFGCGTLPDAKPFAEATGVWSATVKTSGQAVSDSLREAGSMALEDKDAYEKNAVNFEAAWAQRVKAAQEVVIYSNAIADLIAASKQSGETVKKVGDALQGLASVVKIPLAEPAVGVAGDLARFLMDRISIVRASKQLEESLAEAQPAVDRITDQLAIETSKQLIPLINETYKNSVSSIKAGYRDDDLFARNFQKKQLEVRSAALADPGKLDPAKLAQLQDIDKIQSAVLARLKERDQKIDVAATAYKSRLQLVNALSTATHAWASAHRDLAAAVKEKRKVNATELQDTVADIKELIKKVRAL